PLEAPPEVVATAVLKAARPGGTPPPLGDAFDCSSMARSYARLYPRAVERTFRPARGEGLWLVTNNFSTGGAQASAGRVLRARGSTGIRVRAATLEEQRDYPTPGRRALTEAGITVLALPPPGS